MNKSVIFKICSIILTVVMCLTVVTGCQRGETVTSSTGSKSESNFERPDTNTSTSKDESYSDDTTNEDTSSKEESSTDESNEETTTTETESINEDTLSEEESSTDESKGETTTVVTENIPYDADKNPLKRGINFNGLESPEDIGDEDWKLQGKYYDLVRDKGFDHVRVAVDFFCRMGEAPEYKINEGFLHKVDRIINLALSANLKVVLDFHHFGEMQTNVEGNKQKFYKMWEQLAEHYQKYPSGLVFELFNEPGNGSALSAGGPDLMTPSKLLEIQEEAIKIIRKTNPTRLIVHATSWNNSWGELMNTEPLLPDDENLIMSAHVYEPMKFTHQGTSWDNPNADKTPYDFTDDMKYEIELAFQAVKNYQEKYGRPVWIGEFGAYNRIAPEGARVKYADFIVKEMKEAKCGWAWWAFKAEFGVYNINTDEWQEDGALIDALMQ